MLGASPKARKGSAVVELGSLSMKKRNPPPPVPPAPVGKAMAMATAAPAAGKVTAEEVWEVRPGGMLVQKRVAGDDEPALEDVKPVPTIRVKAKHCGMTHEIYISAEATFGDVRKMVAERAGAHPDDLKVRYKDKERDAKAFLDMAGVKDRSRITVVDDPEARARRLLEERRQGHLQKASKAVAAVAAEVDKIAPKVSVLEALVRKGERVAEKDVTTVTELLMNELLKLDAVVAGGDDVKAQRRVQVKRVQKYVETLDAVMAKNATIASRKSGAKKQASEQPAPPARQQQQQPQSQRQRQKPQQQQPQAETTRWEMFDLLSSLPSTSSASSTTTMSSTASSGGPPPPTNKLDWMLF